MDNETFKILGIPGSLRRNSYNVALLRAAKEVAPEGVDVRIYSLAGIPMYNADVDALGLPEPVRRLKEAIRAADALLIATPEYNYSIPGVLKNAIDWVSRPPDNVLKQKPAAIMGVSPDMGGTIRAQLALRQVLAYTETYALLKPELTLTNARSLFDAEGRLQDPATRERLRALIEALVEWAHRLERGLEPRPAQSPALTGAAR